MFLNLDHNEIVFSLCIFSKQKNTMDIRYRCLLGSETQQNHIFIVYKKKTKKSAYLATLQCVRRRSWRVCGRGRVGMREEGRGKGRGFRHRGKRESKREMKGERVKGRQKRLGVGKRMGSGKEGRGKGDRWGNIWGEGEEGRERVEGNDYGKG